MDRSDQFPGISFHALHRAHHNAMQADLAGAGLADLGSPFILMILHSRGRNGEIKAQRELSDALNVSPAAIAVSLKSLERLGYVEKRLDSQDGRCKRIAITAKGVDAVEKTWTVFQQVDTRMMEGFSPDERDALSAFHRRMLRNLMGTEEDLKNPFERMGCQCSKP